MKKYLILLISVILFASCTPMTMITSPVIIEEKSPSMNKNDLFVTANLWMIDVFNDAKSVIQFSDKEAGVLKGRYVWFYRSGGQYIPEYEFTATITIYVKDNNIRLEIQSEPYPASINLSGMTDLNAVFNKKVSSIKESFQTKFE